MADPALAAAPNSAPAPSKRRRPSASSERRRAPRIVSARMTDEAYDEFCRRAAAAGVGPSTYAASLIDAELARPAASYRRAPRDAPSPTRDRAAALARELGRLTGELKDWMRGAREIGVPEDSIDAIGRLTPLAREALAEALGTVRDLRRD